MDCFSEGASGVWAKPTLVVFDYILNRALPLYQLGAINHKSQTAAAFYAAIFVSSLNKGFPLQPLTHTKPRKPYCYRTSRWSITILKLFVHRMQMAVDFLATGVLVIHFDRANKMKTRLLSILNHDLRSPVNSFIRYIQFRKESPELLEAAKMRIENATPTSAKKPAAFMKEILWIKDQMKNFAPKPEKFNIKSMFEAIETHFSAFENASVVFDYSDLEIDAYGNYLKTIVRNLAVNAINATRDIPNAKITWRAWRENRKAF